MMTPKYPLVNTVTVLLTVYAFLSSWLLIALANGSVSTFFDILGLQGGYNEIYTFILIAFIGTIFSTMIKKGRFALMAMGTVFVFIALTLNQDQLVRYLVLAAFLFTIGMYGMIVSRNAVRVLMSIELMLNAVNINLVAFARYVDPIHIRGQIFAVFILTVAAAEAAVGLAVVLAVYRNMATVDMERFNLLKW